MTDAHFIHCSVCKLPLALEALSEGSLAVKVLKKSDEDFIKDHVENCIGINTHEETKEKYIKRLLSGDMVFPSNELLNSPQ